MQQFLLLLCSLFLGLVCYYSVIRVHADLRKPYLLLLVYRFIFFAVQSIFFYSIYKNELDPFFYHQTLITLFDDFRNYPLDAVLFFKSEYDAMHIEPELKNYFVTEVRAAFFIKILIPFFTLSANNYYLAGAWLTLFGSLCFVPFLSLFKRSSKMLIWLIVLLVPSFSFWTVGIVKEAFALPSLFLLFYLLNQLLEQKRKKVLLLFIFIALFILVWQVKYYLASLFLLVYVTYYLIRYASFSASTVVVFVAVLLGILLVAGLVHPALQWDVFPEVIYISNQLTCTKYVDAYACIPFDLDKTWYSVFMNFPKAMVYAFFSPFPWQIHNITSLLAAIENYICMVLLASVLVQWKNKKITLVKTDLFVLLVILFLGALLIMASPNIGSFSRYRIFYLPVYIYLILTYSGIHYTALFLRFKNWIEK